MKFEVHVDLPSKAFHPMHHQSRAKKGFITVGVVNDTGESSTLFLIRERRRV